MNVTRAVTLITLAVSGFATGTWATIQPQNFFTRFPGAGTGWLGTDGPYNEHLVRDVGAVYLALAVTSGYAAVQRSASTERTAGVCWAAFTAVHLSYHLDHLTGQPAGTQVGLLATSVVTLAASVLLMLRPRREAPLDERRDLGT